MPLARAPSRRIGTFPLPVEPRPLPVPHVPQRLTATALVRRLKCLLANEVSAHLAWAAQATHFVTRPSPVKIRPGRRALGWGHLRHTRSRNIRCLQSVYFAPQTASCAEHPVRTSHTRSRHIINLREKSVTKSGCMNRTERAWGGAHQAVFSGTANAPFCMPSPETRLLSMQHDMCNNEWTAGSPSSPATSQRATGRHR